MRKFATCFFALLLYAPSAFGASASRIVPSKTDSEGVISGGKSVGAPRINSSRIASHTTTVDTELPLNTARTTVSRTILPTDKEDIVVPRAAATRNAQSQSGDVRSKLDAAVNTVGRNARVSAASINSNPSLRRAGVVLRPSTSEVGGRATIAGTDVQTGSNVDEEVRGVKSRAAQTRESVAEAKERLEQTAELNKSCQEQYNDCMDQFCAVVDANQGRCSCSANLSKYTRVEEAVKDANAQLNQVAQRIRYVGLSADEIRAILNETEAEEALSGQKDTTETRNMLERIEDLIKDPKNITASYTESGFGLDMNLDFSSDTADLFNLDFLTLGTSGSFSNLRGTDLYNAARSRCSTILNQCKEAGGTAKQITGNYDLAIDKDCIAYEKGLKKMNETLVSNVRSAEVMLQKARLAVLQNKNQYDAKGCIAALDSCMRDDMVCGDDYYKCVDPTKRYIDENGNVVLGQNISLITEFMDDYNNATTKKEFLEKSATVELTPEKCKTPQVTKSSDTVGDGSCVVRYLLEKIGTGERATDGGLCRAVLDKCQYYTYNSSGTYQPYNDVVVNYIQRAMVNIRASQRDIISEYASNCMVDVAQCYNDQVTQVNSWSSSASIKSIYNVMRGACRSVALTCGYAIFAGPPGIDMTTGSVSTGCPEVVENCKDFEGEQRTTCQNGEYVNCVSEMFYESLLCPENSEYQTKEGTAGVNYYVNARCKCKTGYEVWENQCLTTCSGDYMSGQRDAYGTCLCIDGYKPSSGVCVKKES